MYFQKNIKSDPDDFIQYSHLQHCEIDTNTYSKINSSAYNADVSISSVINKEFAFNEDDSEFITKQNREITKSLRKKSVDSYDVHIVRNESNDNNFYNYEEIFHKANDENKDGRESEEKSNRSLHPKKRKNVEIYISDQEEKIYKTYKDEIKFIGKISRNNKRIKSSGSLNKDRENKKIIEKPCFQLCCSIV